MIGIVLNHGAPVRLSVPCLSKAVEFHDFDQYQSVMMIFFRDYGERPPQVSHFMVVYLALFFIQFLPKNYFCRLTEIHFVQSFPKQILYFVFNPSFFISSEDILGLILYQAGKRKEKKYLNCHRTMKKMSSHA